MSSASAAPEPWLAPSGPLELGPWTASRSAPAAERRGRVQLDPETGGLWLELVDIEVSGSGPPLRLRRTWRDGAWYFEFEDHLLVDAESVTLVTDQASTRLDPSTGPGLAVNEFAEGWLPGSRFGETGQLLRTEGGWELVEGELTSGFDEQGRLQWRRDAYGTVQSYTYDATGLSRIEQDGRWMKILRDTDGRPSAVASPGGREHFYRNRDGLLKVSIDAQGRQVRYTYDQDGRPIRIAWADGSFVRIAWEDGRVGALSSSEGWLQTYTWRGEELRVVGPGSKRWTLREDDAERSVTDASGRTVRSLYGAGHLVGWVDAAGGRTTLVRDDAGRLVEIRSPDGARWKLARDDAGQVSSLSDAAGASWEIRRDSAGRVRSVREPAGRVLVFDRDAEGRLRSVGPQNASVTLRRDARGLVSAIEQPLGGTTRLGRDAAGRINEISDPSGAHIVLQAFEGDLPGQLVDRNGTTWTLRRDGLGRVRSIELAGQVLASFRRGAAGALDRVQAEGVELRLRRDASGNLVQLVDGLGGAWSVIRDGLGRPTGLRAPEGAEVLLSWSTLDRLVSVAGQELRRDSRGRPVELGDVSWAWSSSGALERVDAGAVQLRFERDGVGDLSAVEIGGERLEVRRDGASRVVGVGGLSLQRDASGLIEGVQAGGRSLRIERDERGLPFRVVDESGRVWRGLYDAEASVSRWTAPDGTSLSVQRDDRGRPNLVRFPDGSLSRHDYAPDLLGSVVEDATGEVLLDQRLKLDANGQVQGIDRDARLQSSEVLHRDAQGALVAQEGSGGAWTWTPDGVAGPGGSRLELDERGRPVRATPPVGPAAWGAGYEVLEYELDEHGCVSAVSGDLGRVELDYDGLGRPVRLAGPEPEQLVELKWDPLGRLVRITGALGMELGWGPSGLLTRDGVPLLHLPGLGLAETGRSPQVIAADQRGLPSVLLQDGELVDWLEWTPLGFPTGTTPSWLGPSGAVALGPGGPWVGPDGLYDPISGTTSCAPADPAPPRSWTGLEGTSEPWWAPDPWMARDPWSDPLGLLVGLEELDPLLEGDWVQLREPPADLPWLPASSRRPALSLLPAEGALPLDLDPVTAVAVSAALPEAHPLRFEALAAAAVEGELDDSWLGLLDPPVPDWLFGEAD